MTSGDRLGVSRGLGGYGGRLGVLDRLRGTGGVEGACNGRWRGKRDEGECLY
jgi:hypothetical protein